MKRVKGFRFMFRLVEAVARFSAGAALCLAVLLTSLIGGCRNKERTAAPAAPVVTTTTIVAKDTPVSQDYIAQTESSHLVNVYARVTGFLERRTYTEGAIVNAGEVLFVMDKKPFQAQVDASAAALSRQKAALETARLNLARTRPLTARKAVSQKDLDDATGAYESSSAQVEQAGAQLETARLNLSYCTIASPISGVTSAALQQDGTYINQLNSKLTTVAALSPMWVNFSLSENELEKYRDEVAKRRIRPPRDHNYEIEIILVDGSLFPHTGRITYAAPSYNSQTGTFQIRASVANPKGVLRPNQYVRVRVKGAIRPNAVLVPQRAVQQGAKGHFAWVVNRESKAEYRPVVVGELFGNDWFIIEGLRAGDQVVLDGGFALRPGVPVTVKPLEAPPESGAARGPAAKTTPAKGSH